MEQKHPASSIADVLHYLNSWKKDHMWSNLVDLIELARRNNPYQKGDPRLMWDEQVGINFPVMYVASIYLYLYGQKNGCDTYLFATRDCCHWVKIFKKLFPDANAHYFHCSRNMLTSASQTHNPEYRKYVQSLIKTSVEKTIYIDIHGTCQRIFQYFESEFGSYPYSFLLSSSYRQYSEFPSISVKCHHLGKLLTLIFDARGTTIEMLNFDTMGTIQDYNQQGPVRDPPEYATKKLEAYHTSIQFVLNQMKPWSKVSPSRHLLDHLNQDELLTLIRKIYRVIQDNQPVLLNYIKHPGKH